LQIIIFNIFCYCWCKLQSFLI